MPTIAWKDGVKAEIEEAIASVREAFRLAKEAPEEIRAHPYVRIETPCAVRVTVTGFSPSGESIESGVTMSCYLSSTSELEVPDDESIVECCGDFWDGSNHLDAEEMLALVVTGVSVRWD